MTKLVLGAFQSEEETITAINVFELAGHQSKNITIFTNEEHAKALENQISVTIKTDSPQPEEEPDSILGKIMNTFSNSNDFELDSHEKLVEFGLPDEKAEQCMADMHSGKIIVIADDNLRMGHPPLSEDYMDMR